LCIKLLPGGLGIQAGSNPRSSSKVFEEEVSSFVGTIYHWKLTGELVSFQNWIGIRIRGVVLF
jgi:hypothetical protein